MSRTVLVTGAGSGIGEACARRLAAAGDQLVLVGRRREALERVADGSNALVLAGDAADSATWHGFVEQIRARFGGLDALVCCAGGHGLGTALDSDDAAWEAAMRGNLHSAFHSARACLPLLIERRGSIVLLGSIASLAATPPPSMRWWGSIAPWRGISGRRGCGSIASVRAGCVRRWPMPRCSR